MTCRGCHREVAEGEAFTYCGRSTYWARAAWYDPDWNHSRDSGAFCAACYGDTDKARRCTCAYCGRAFGWLVETRGGGPYCRPWCETRARHARERARRRASLTMTCAECGAALGEAARSDARYCSPACRQKAYRRRRAGGGD